MVQSKCYYVLMIWCTTMGSGIPVVRSFQSRSRSVHWSSSPVSSAFNDQHRFRKTSLSTIIISLASSSSDDDNNNTETKNNNKNNVDIIGSRDSQSRKKSSPAGVYVRPSAAVERGSGFFFPGLEGPRVRLVVGSLLLVVTGINHAFSSSTSAFSEALAVLYSLLVLLQGAIESSKEGRIETIAARKVAKDSSKNGDNGASRGELFQQWSRTSADSLSQSKEVNESWRDRVEWAASSFLSLTPATHVLLIRQQQSLSTPMIDYWLGVTGIPQTITSTVESAATAAIETIQQSTSGRVALPSDHPAVLGLAPEGYRRCVILQRISSNTCLMVCSDDLLASFTRQDLQWLGRLAIYVQEKSYYA